MSERASMFSQETWFFVYFVAAGLFLLQVLSPFLTILLYAAVAAVVTWPIHARMLEIVHGRTYVAAVGTTLLLALMIGAPGSMLTWTFLQEGAAIIEQAIAWGSSGAPEELATGLVTSWRPTVESWTGPIPEEWFAPAKIVGPLQQAALTALNAAGSSLPGLVNALIDGSIDLLVFGLAVLTFYADGPALLAAIAHLSPLDDRHEARMFEAFREFAFNLVVASAGTAAAQGVVASLGYAIAGLDRVVFLGVATAIFSFVPMVGTAVVWIPASFLAASLYGTSWGVFVALWSIIVTGTVDNLLKPFFLSGSSDAHPLLIFLAVFGGMAWFGLPGLLIGPISTAVFLALYTIYVEEYAHDREVETVD
jgi:predicted PurR-regulated permease PerM